VVITGVGVVNAGIVGDSAAVGAFLAAPRPTPGVEEGGIGRVPSATLTALIDAADARRLSRVCQLAVAAARLAVRESGVDPARGLGLVVGTEFGDLASTHAFADGFLERGPSGLSALLFPSTVMNTMVATTAIAVGARELALTINVPTVAGEVAVARAAAAVASGRAEAVLAGGVDELDPLVAEMLAALGDGGRRGEGATFLVLEAEPAARARGARIGARIAGAAWRALPAAPWGVGRRLDSRAIAQARARAGGAVPAWLYASASGDARRDAWESRVLEAAPGLGRPPGVSLASLVGHHAGLGVLHVAAAGWTARSGLLPAVDGGAPRRVSGAGLVHGLARGGGHVALVVDDGDEPRAGLAGTARAVGRSGGPAC
jgi:3-oxoacyl-[acyl-carrier-protein] synthase II